MDTMFLRREATPIDLWLAAVIKGSEGVPLTVSEMASRLKDALVVRAYRARPGQVFRQRSEAPEQFQVGESLYANTNRRWLPEFGTPGPLFDVTDLVRVACLEVFPPNDEMFGITDHNSHHSSTPARNVTISLGKLGDTFGLMVQVRVNVDWNRIHSYPELVALQAYLDVTSMNIPGLTGYAVPEPKEILLAETKTGSDAYSAMLSRARGLEHADEMDGARRIYEEVLARWPHANEVYERFERTYWAGPPGQAQLAVCSRAIEAMKSPNYDDAVVWGSSMMDKPREVRIAAIDERIARQRKFWGEKASELRRRIQSPDPRD